MTVSEICLRVRLRVNVRAECCFEFRFLLPLFPSGYSSPCEVFARVFRVTSESKKEKKLFSRPLENMCHPHLEDLLLAAEGDVCQVLAGEEVLCQGEEVCLVILPLEQVLLVHGDDDVVAGTARARLKNKKDSCCVLESNFGSARILMD